MPATETRRTTVAREQPAWLRWLLGVGVLFLGGVLAGIARSYVDATPGDAVAVATLVGAAVLAARQARPELTPGHAAATLLLPVPAAFALWLVVVPFGEGDPEVDWMALRLLALWEVVLLAASALRVVGRTWQRARSGARGPEAGLASPDHDLDDATAFGSAVTAVREYPDDDWGRARLREDRRRFADRGYVLVEVETLDGAQEWARDAQLVSPIPLVGLDTTSEPTLIATFKRGSLSSPADGSHGDGTPAPHVAPAPAQLDDGRATRTGAGPGRRAGRRDRARR